MDGLDVARAIRRDSTLPIIMLTARDDELDRVLGLEIGADDYVTKPFSPARAGGPCQSHPSTGRRQGEPSDRIEVGGVSIDIARMRVAVAGRTVELTPTEFQLLVTLARQPGRIFTRSQLLDSIHGRGLRIVRASDRRSRQEPAPQARERPRPTAVPADRLRRGLSIRRGARVSQAREAEAAPGTPAPIRPSRLLRALEREAGQVDAIRPDDPGRAGTSGDAASGFEDTDRARDGGPRTKPGPPTSEFPGTRFGEASWSGSPSA